MDRKISSQEKRAAKLVAAAKKRDNDLPRLLGNKFETLPQQLEREALAHEAHNAPQPDAAVIGNAAHLDQRDGNVAHAPPARRPAQSLHLDRRTLRLIEALEQSSELTLSITVYREGLSPDQLADLLGISKDTLQRLRTTGEGPPFLELTPFLLRYPPHGVFKWLESRTRTRSRSRAVA